MRIQVYRWEESSVMLIVTHIHVFVSRKVMSTHVVLQWTHLIVRSQRANNGNFPLRHVHICQKLHMEVST